MNKSKSPAENAKTEKAKTETPKRYRVCPKTALHQCVHCSTEPYCSHACQIYRWGGSGDMSGCQIQVIIHGVPELHFDLPYCERIGPAHDDPDNFQGARVAITLSLLREARIAFASRSLLVKRFSGKLSRALPIPAANRSRKSVSFAMSSQMSSPISQTPLRKTP